MRGRLFFIYLFVAIAALMLSSTGCSRFQKPSDAEVLKAIDDSGILKGKAFTVTSPLVIVERGSRKKDGSWPVKVKMTLTMQMLDGKISEPRENTTWFRIFKSKDTAGNVAWKAMLGS
jgi:hypothetical protein